MANNNRFKTGDEFLPFHRKASHVGADYRDGWNDCYAAALAVQPAKPALAWMLEHAKILAACKAEAEMIAATQPAKPDLLARLDAAELDAARWNFLIAYLVSDETNLDDAIVAADSCEKVTAVIDAAMKGKP